MTTGQMLLTVAIVSIITIGLRAAPFLIFPDGRKPPRLISWMGRLLPRAVIAMLVVYCLKDVHLAEAAGWLPALVGVVVTAALHAWKRQMILSICGGTAVYMLLLRLMGAA